MKLNELKCKSENINVDEYLAFREQVKNSMKYPDWLGDFSRDDLTFLLQHGVKIWIYYNENEPVCSMMLIPCDENALTSFALNMQMDYRYVVDFGPMFVNPKYVGNKLQYQMLKELDKYSINSGYRWAICTVHPDNKYSINNLLLDEFEFKKTKTFKRGLRNVYLKYIID